MNKKFLSVVLFGALMAGSSVTFTGCIDNDEPAGIEELRGAKAELIKANAAYRQAEVEIKKVDIERRQILLEREKIDMEMQKLDLEIKKASSARDIAYWEQEKALLVENYKTKILVAQTNAANWEINYLKALADLKIAQATVTDEAYAKKLGELIADIEKEQSNIMGLNNALFELAQELLAFSSGQYEAIKATAESDLKNHESKLENMTTILEEVKTLQADFGTEAINAQIKELDVKIAKIDKKTAELRSALIEVIGTATEPEQTYSKQKVTLETANQSITFDIPAAIQADFIKEFVTNANDNGELKSIVGKGDAWDKFAATAPTDEKKKWTPVINNVALGAVTQYEKVDTTKLLSYGIKELSTAIKEKGVSSYKVAYEFANNGFNYGLGSLSVGDELTADDLAKGKAALELIEKDIVAMQKIYTADSTAFVEAVKAYQKDAEAYGLLLQTSTNQDQIVTKAWNEYTDAKKKYTLNEEVEDAWTKAQKTYQGEDGKGGAKKVWDDFYAKAKENNPDDPTQYAGYAAAYGTYQLALQAYNKAKETYDKAVAAAEKASGLSDKIKALKTTLTAYYPLRAELMADLDDITATLAGFNDGKEFKLAEKISSLTDAQFSEVVAKFSSKVAIAGDDVTLAGTSVEPDGKGSLQAWLKASQKLYGGDSYDIAQSVIQDIATIEPNNKINIASLPTATALVTLQHSKSIFANIDSWNTLATTIEGIATATAKKEEPIVAELNKQSAAIKAIYEPYRDTFYELCALDIDQYDKAGDKGTDIFKKLKEALNITAKPNTEGEKQTLTKLKEALEKRMEGSSNSVTISFDVYTEFTKGELVEGARVTSIKLTEEDIQDAIDKLEKNINLLGEYIAAKKDEIKKLEDGTLTIDDFIAREKEKIENEIAFKEEQIKNAQERFDALNKAKDALIAEFAGSAE